MIHPTTTYANAVISSDPQALHAIHSDDKNIAIYERELTALVHELKQVMNHPIECRTSGSVEDILSSLKDQFDASPAACPLLFQDIASLLNWFADLTKAASFRLLLTAVSSDMCRKFHTDINDLRLLCTYVGPGTLWLPDEVLPPDMFEAGRAAKELVVEEHHIQQVDTGNVVLLKGALHKAANPILHRSPAVEATGETRFILRLDTNEFLNF